MYPSEVTDRGQYLLAFTGFRVGDKVRFLHSSDWAWGSAGGYQNCYGIVRRVIDDNTVRVEIFTLDGQKAGGFSMNNYSFDTDAIELF
jgi:hypothetical protein